MFYSNKQTSKEISAESNVLGCRKKVVKNRNVSEYPIEEDENHLNATYFYDVESKEFQYLPRLPKHSFFRNEVYENSSNHRNVVEKTCRFSIPLRFSSCEKESYYHLRITGPSMSGKTSFVQFLRYGHHVRTHPTKATEVSCVKWNDESFIFWDSRTPKDAENKPALPVIINFSMSYSKMKKKILSCYQMDALIYVLDGSNRGRLKIAAKDFGRVLRRYHNVPIVLLLATKKDLANCVRQDEIELQLRIPESVYDRECAIHFISNVTGEGLDEAMEWIFCKIKERQSWIFPFLKFLPSHAHSQENRLPFFSFTWNCLNCCYFQ